LRYIQSKDPGFNRNQVLVVKNMNALHNPVLFKKEVKQLRGVMNATLTDYSPTGGSRWHNFGSTGTGAAIQTEFWSVDEDYLNTMGMHLVKGRSFSNQLASDSTGIILNETAAKMFGVSNDPLNKEITYPSYKNLFHVIGVVKDFNFSSMREKITPLVLVLNKATEGSLHVRINTHDMPRLVNEVGHTWKSLSSEQQFDYSFMDEDFDAIYRSEQHMGQLSIVLTVLSVIIACLGLFGLAAFAAEQRTKEIGVRKVLGASVSGIVVMLSKDFIRLVCIAILIASPIAWFFMQQWLQNFAYRIPMNGWLPAIAGSASILISFITISFQSIKAAMMNPVKGLKGE
jgi:putative ABC transport system permease protein